MDNLIKINHKDWIGDCFIENSKIYRKDMDDEKGNFKIYKNTITIFWEKWDNDKLFTNDFINYYLYDTIQEKFSEIFLFYKNEMIKFTIDYEKLKIVNNNFEFRIEIEKNFLTIIKDNDLIKFKRVSDKYYIKEEDLVNNFFILDIFTDNNLKKILFDKKNKFFYNINNSKDNGKFNIKYNLLELINSNSEKQNFFTNSFYQEIKNYNNVNILKPNSIFYDDKVLFSNITLCNNKIILTSINYLYHPWDFDEIKIFFPNNKIIKRNNFLYENYESCVIIVFELLYTNCNEDIIIEYNKNKYEINLKQINLPKKNIYAVTLFKDDYMLLSKYLEYYSNLGIDCFLFYYNDIIDDELINKINNINNNKYEIYIFEWDYKYWWKHNNNPKHHHAQTMSINDSLNILKNYSKYILYNDLDEYIKLNINFEDLITENNDIDIFQFKCQFCKMGNDKIKYCEFKDNYNENNIVLGNYWDKFREKNLIKCSKFNIFGIHNYVEEFSKECNLIIKQSGYFYHFINFFEKYRPELMTQYIS